jgi:hypothetical protein
MITNIYSINICLLTEQVKTEISTFFLARFTTKLVLNLIVQWDLLYINAHTWWLTLSHKDKQSTR